MEIPPGSKWTEGTWESFWSMRRRSRKGSGAWIFLTLRWIWRDSVPEAWILDFFRSMGRKKKAEEGGGRTVMKTGILAAAAFCLTLFLVCCALPAGGTVTGKETRIELGRETNRILGPGAEESGRRIVISEGGSYRVTGSLTGGQLYVDAPGKEVALILDGASIIKDGDAAIYVNGAAQTEIWLEEGTENLLQSREDPEKAPEENAEDAVIFSESSLTVGGTGALTVTGETGHGLQSRRSLFLTGETITAETRKDGFKAEETLSVAGGSILARCGEKGFQTDESLEISGGTVRTETGDDAFHSNRYARISGGTLRIDTVEKGIHADQELTVDGGTVRVMDSVEGLEANQVRITGGELSIVASDDGINANGEPEGKGEKGSFPACIFREAASSLTRMGTGWIPTEI